MTAPSGGSVPLAARGERIALAVVGVAFAATVLLPDRTTVRVLSTMWDGFIRALKTAMGRA